MVVHRQFKRTTLIKFGLALFLVGLITAKVLETTNNLVLVGLILILNLFLLRRQKYKFLLSFILCIVFLSGLHRGSLFVSRIDDYKNLYYKQVTFLALAKEDAVYSERKQLIFSSSNIELVQPKRSKLVGNIQIEGMGTTMVYKGDKLMVSGKLYPKRGENIAGISFANIKVVSRGTSKIDKMRRQFSAGLQNVLPEPLASLGLGILIGQQKTLPDELTKELRQVGLIHIVAVSGYNLTVIIYFSQRLLQKRSRFQAFVVSSTLVGLFLLVTGFSPSIVRASVVSLISLVMWYYGRKISPMMILLLVAVITAGWNPLYIWASVGWYLSFAAFFGVLVLGPLLHARFISKTFKGKLLPQIFTETISAQICTIPILLFIFSTFSFVSIITNLLVVPLIPFVMLASLVAGLYGMIGPFLLGGVLVLPARVLLGYIVEITQIFSLVPHAFVEVEISAYQTGFLYLLIIIFIFLLTYTSKRTHKLTSNRNEPIV